MKFKDLKPIYFKGKPPKIKEGDSLIPYLTPEYIRTGAIPDFYPNQSGIVLAEDGDLILLWDGSNAGEFFKGKRGILSSTMVKIAPISITDSEYIYYSLKLQEPSLKSKTSGSGIPHVDKEALFNLEVFLPEKRHQTTIATILSTIDQAIEKTERLIAKYERIKTGLMQDLLTRGIDEQGRIRSEETHAFKESALGRIPVEWEVERFEKIAFPIDPQPDHRAPMESENGVPYVGINDIDEFSNVRANCRKVVFTALIKQRERFSIDEGDIIFGKIGTIGFPKKLKANQKITISANVIVLKPLVHKPFVYWLLEADFVKKQVANYAFSTSQAAFGMDKVRSILVIVPDPNEMIRIANLLDNTHATINAERKNLSKLKSQKTALMQDLLTGRVRVDGLTNL